MNVNGYRQADKRWSKMQLGEGASTLGKGGCLVTCFGIARETLIGEVATPDITNAKCKIAKAFLAGTSKLVPRLAAPALGLELLERVDEVQPTDPNIVRVVKRGLDAGGVAIVEVDHNRLAGGDHFVVVFEQQIDGTFRAWDPAPGVVLTLAPNLTGLSYWGREVKSYQPVGSMAIRRISAS